MELAELARLLEAEVERGLSPKRATHSMGVAVFAAQLCERNGIDPLKGRVAGLGHDLCKEMKVKDQRRLFDLFRTELEPGLERGLGLVPGAPVPGAHMPGHGEADSASGFSAETLLHGPAAAALLRRDFGLRDADILEAIAWHTTGRPGMPPLAVVLYCADKIEPGRRHVDDAFRRRCLGMALPDMLLAVVENSLAWLRRKEWEIAPQTLLLYNALRKPVATP
jgi:nicotinate-nucleotide adenylyltransferase